MKKVLKKLFFLVVICVVYSFWGNTNIKIVNAQDVENVVVQDLENGFVYTVEEKVNIQPYSRSTVTNTQTHTQLLKNLQEKQFLR